MTRMMAREERGRRRNAVNAGRATNDRNPTRRHWASFHLRERGRSGWQRSRASFPRSSSLPNQSRVSNPLHLPPRYLPQTRRHYRNHDLPFSQPHHSPTYPFPRRIHPHTPSQRDEPLFPHLHRTGRPQGRDGRIRGWRSYWRRTERGRRGRLGLEVGLGDLAEGEGDDTMRND